MLILPTEMFAMYCCEGRVGIKCLQLNPVIVNSGGRFKFRFMHFCLVKLKGASSDKLTPVCGHTGQPVVNPCTIVGLPIVKQIPSGFTPRPPNCTKARQNKFTFEDPSNPWANFDSAGQRSTNWKLDITNSSEDLQIYLHFANIF